MVELPEGLQAEKEAVENTAEAIDEEGTGRDDPPPFDFTPDSDEGG